MLKISSILIGVSDLNKAKEFYEKAFGFSFEEFRPPFSSAMFDGIEFNIEEDAPTRDAGWAGKNIGGRKNVSFETDDLDAFLKSAAKNGASIVKPATDTPWQWREAIIADPDGNEFLVEQDCEK